MDNSNKISVIVPVYNVEKYVSRCIESILGQSYKNIELILVEDESPDNSGKICDEYKEKDERVKVIHQKNGGVSSARNRGLKECTGDYVHFCDADDWIDENTYETILSQIVEEDADVAYFGWYVDDGKKLSVEQTSNAPTGVGNSYDLFYNILIKCGSYGKKAGYGNYIWNKIYKKSSLMKPDGSLSLFDETVSVAEDGIWLVETARTWNKCVMDNRPYYHYFRNPGSVMSSPEKYHETRLGSETSHMRMLDILKEFNTDLYEVHKKTCTDFFWAHANTNTDARNSQFVAAVITNIIKINDGVCPPELAKAILFLQQNYAGQKKLLNRKYMKASVKVQNLLDKTILRGKQKK